MLKVVAFREADLAGLGEPGDHPAHDIDRHDRGSGCVVQPVPGDSSANENAIDSAMPAIASSVR